MMAEGHCAMVGIIFLHQHMAVEPAHFRDGENADAAKGTGSHRKNLPVCHISLQLCVSGGLQAEECDIARDDIAFQRALGHFLRQSSCHNHLVLHVAEGQLAAAGISAVEAHKSIFMSVIVLVFNF